MGVLFVSPLAVGARGAAPCGRNRCTQRAAHRRAAFGARLPTRAPLRACDSGACAGKLVARQRSASRRLLRLAPLALLLPTQALASAAGVAAGATSFASAAWASLALVLVSEIGDKTFFISALLSMRYSRVLVLVGTMAALAAMTVISVLLGQALHAVPATLALPFPVDDYAAVALLLYFGIQNLRDGWAMPAEAADELDGARATVGADGAVALTKSPARIISETCSVIFFAEWGDKSMLATIALAAAKNPVGVIVGGVTGHLIATLIAVVGGSLLGKYVSERNARIFGGVLFLVFAALTLRGVW